MDTVAVVVLAPCAVVALIVVVIALKPAAASAVAEVMNALAAVLGSVVPWSTRRRPVGVVAADWLQPEVSSAQAPGASLTPLDPL